MKIKQASLPSNHPDLAIELNNLAGLYYSQGKYGKAELLCLESLLIRVQALPENHPSLNHGWDNVIDFYQTALAAGLTDTRLRQHPLGSTILSRL